MPTTLVVLAIALVTAAVAYYLLVTTEGTYLGARVVALLYDWSARSYDRIKNLHVVNEARHIGIPLSERLMTLGVSRLLDVGCGTGRVASALRLAGDYQGTIIGLDRSRGMLRQAAERLCPADDPTHLMIGDAQHVPLADASVGAVTCLEAIEFFPSPRDAMAEFWRVLEPGGLLLTSNRVGMDAGWLPFRHVGRGKLEALVQATGFVAVDTERWQVHYDLIWALKPHTSARSE